MELAGTNGEIYRLKQVRTLVSEIVDTAMNLPYVRTCLSTTGSLTSSTSGVEHSTSTTRSITCIPDDSLDDEIRRNMVGDEDYNDCSGYGDAPPLHQSLPVDGDPTT